MGKAKITTKDAGSGKRVKWLRYVFSGIAVFGLYHILSGPSGVLNLVQLRESNAALAAELDSLESRKRDLIVDKRRLEKDSAYLERIARKELGMAKPDEKVFRFVPHEAGKRPGRNEGE